MIKPAVGRTVHVLVDPDTNNGSDFAPAVITRVWSDHTVNLRVLLDSDETPRLTSVALLAERPSPEALAESPHPFLCFWPPRV